MKAVVNWIEESILTFFKGRIVRFRYYVHGKGMRLGGGVVEDIDCYPDQFMDYYFNIKIGGEWFKDVHELEFVEEAEN